MPGKKKLTERNYHGKRLTDDAPFAVQEAFRSLRASVSYTASKDGKRLYGITSAHAGAGKSLLIANLAISFSKLGKKVLLIDADMRCPVQASIFEQSNEMGLTEYLAGHTDEVCACVKETTDKGLFLMNAGAIPPNPAELLASARMEQLLASVGTEYDYVFVDLPPICDVSDAGILAGVLTGYLFVVRMGRCEMRDLREAEAALLQCGANICGVIVNDLRAKKSGYYHSKRYGYGYGYKS